MTRNTTLTIHNTDLQVGDRCTVVRREEGRQTSYYTDCRTQGRALIGGKFRDTGELPTIQKPGGGLIYRRAIGEYEVVEASGDQITVTAVD